MGRHTPLLLTATIAAGLLLNGAADLSAEQLSEGHPHKWEVVNNQSMYDFVSHGFELKSVAYDTSVLGPQSDSPDVHYFLQKGRDLVRCDFRKRDQTSYYWCYKLAKAHHPQ
jgi:hypothetical protein